MRILGIYSFKNGKEIIERNFSKEFENVKKVISEINANKYITKVSKEKTMKGTKLYNPIALNQAFKKKFFALEWKNHKIDCEYPVKYYIDGYQPQKIKIKPYRDMDFVKNRLGIEVQFGKYSFMVYNVCAKMTIFHNLNIIDAGIEIVPIKELALRMSTGVSYFEQFVWDLEQRGFADIDIPVLILGIGE